MSGLVLAGVHRRFRTGKLVARAVDGVDLGVAPGEIVGLVGESGCGKTTLARIAVGLDRPDEGRVELDGAPLLRGDGGMEPAQRRRVQYVFQDPYGSFNPRRSIGQAIHLPLALHGRLGRDAGQQIAGLLAQVGLDPALAPRRPHELSGGQLQRAAIARALALEPEILVCDEPVASLDVSVRAQVLNVLLSLWRDRGIGILFVSHDLGVVRRIADRVVVMYLGRVVEEGANETVWSAPRHPYTRSLAASIPTGAADWRKDGERHHLTGEPPSPFSIPPGCRFHPRCPLAIARCSQVDPVLRMMSTGQRAACDVVEPSAEALAGQTEG